MDYEVRKEVTYTVELDHKELHTLCRMLDTLENLMLSFPAGSDTLDSDQRYIKNQFMQALENGKR